ncbi:MAG: hypothetical protein EOP46_16380 [Sphingobacteriaceae bacterium]|nr:MAG: hypothetical protein EOP46_16380 [Sphingobacteriaceae bacterium]
MNLGKINNRVIQYQKYDDGNSWANFLPDKSWVAFIICDDKEISELDNIAQIILGKQPYYICCAGSQGEVLHDIIDENIVLFEIERDIVMPFQIMTTWHDEGIKEGLWYTIYGAELDLKVDIVFCLNGTEVVSEADIQRIVETL